MSLPDPTGTKIPDLTYLTLEGGALVPHTTTELFKGKKVVLFGLPGAFTPTCSSSHVPRYHQLAPTFAKLGVDHVVCVSVNDAFVMDAWRRDQGADDLVFYPDGNGELTKALGLLVDKSQIGFGSRSWRYSVLIEDGVVTHSFIEPEKPGDPFEVSDADTMLKFLAPKQAAPANILLFTKPGCSHCARAKAALNKAGVQYDDVSATPGMLRAVSSTPTTPRVFVDGALLGGADELLNWLGERG